jgi:hypothetical protein
MFVTLLHPREQRQVPRTRVIEKYALFKNNIAVLGASYSVNSSVPIEVFREFASALEDDRVVVTNANFDGLSMLSAEFAFEAMAAQLSDFRSSAAFAAEVAHAEARALEGTAMLRGCRPSLD